MDEKILVEYCKVKAEAKDLRKRIDALDKFLKNPPIVADTVKGSRKDLTIGPIKVTGIPDPEYTRKERMRTRYQRMLELKEDELLELICQAEEYIETIEKSELRMMFRFVFLDGLSYPKTAACMNKAFPNRKVKYTDESVRKRIQRFFEKDEKCPTMCG